jgi:hypothetical protein
MNNAEVTKFCKARFDEFLNLVLSGLLATVTHLLTQNHAFYREIVISVVFPMGFNTVSEG